MIAAEFLASLETPIDPAIVSEIAEEIASVEEELLKQVNSQVRLVGEIGRHVLLSGGKRLRPAFLGLSARAAGNAFDVARTRKLAACMEMIHMATLIHDDVIDHASSRRGRATANALFGNTASILSGDALLAKAMSILAMDGDLEIIRTVSSAVVELAEGEVLEVQNRGRFDLGEEEHIEVLRMKTASFIQCCCEVGARVAGANDETRDALGAFGHHIGLSFQIVDDLLDYRGRQTGKPLAGDFREGCATLPLIYLSERLSRTEREFVAAKFGQNPSEDDVLSVTEWMADRGAFEQAESLARRHIAQARERLALLPDVPSKALLDAAAEFVVLRKS